MNSQNTYIPFLLTSKILDLLYINGATYDECEDILSMVKSELDESKRQIEYQSCSNYVSRNKVCHAGQMPMHCRMNSEYIQDMIIENHSFVY